VKKSNSISFLLLLCAARLFSQTGDSSWVYKPKVLVIPYEEVMLVSDITNELAEGSGMSPFDVKSACRSGLTIAITDEADERFEATHLLSTIDSLGQSPLQKVFFSISRSYQAIPTVATSSKRTDSTNTRLSAEEKMNHRFLDKMERHLAATVQDTALVTYLHRHFNFDFLLLINQLDFIQTDDALTKAAGKGERWIRVHYTLLNSTGKNVSGGIARCSFPKEKNNIWELALMEFPTCGEQIWQKLSDAIQPLQISE